MSMKHVLAVALAIAGIFVGIDLSKFVLAKVIKPKS